MRKLFDFVFPYKNDSFWERKCGEHVSIGPVTVYGFNAMHVALNIRTPLGFVCFHPEIRVFGKWWPWYFYISKDGTPYNCSVKFGSGGY